MRRFLPIVLITVMSVPLMAQPTPPARGRMMRPPGAKSFQVVTAESAIKQAMDQLAEEKKAYDRDLDVLQHLRTAEAALVDPMQPHNAIEKAYEETDAAYRLDPELPVKNGIAKARSEVEAARLSPGTADFGRLRGTLRGEAIGPAVRVVARNGARLSEETLSWIRIQELISAHLHTLAEISAESLRAAQQ